MPEIRKVFAVRHALPVVWAAFQDLPEVVRCIPGATLTEPPSGDHAAGRIAVKLGPVRADFGGEVRIATDPADNAGVLIGTGVDKGNNSRAKGTLRYKLDSASEGRATTVTITADYVLTGTLAQFSRGGIVEAVVDRICQQFAANLEQRLDATRAPPSVGAPAGDPTAVTPEPDQKGDTALNLLTLVLALIRDKIRAMFRRAG